MHSFQKPLIALAGFLVMAGLIAASPQTSKAQNRANFDQQTVAKRYNLSFFGTGKDGNSISGVGWFEANEAGSITGAKLALVIGLAAQHRTSFELLPGGNQTITLKDASNGIYQVDILIGNSLEQVRFVANILLDDPRGRNGKLAGSYSFILKIPFDEQGAGVSTGEITAQ